jgi:hypothetical protein
MSNVNLANGQLATSSATLLSSTSGRVSILCRNTSASLTETVVLTLAVAAGTARSLVRAVLAPNEALLVTNLPLDTADVLAGSTSDATTVDYLVTQGDGRGFVVASLDANGALKQVNTGVSGNQTISGTLSVVNVNATPGASTAAAGTTTADATALPSGTAHVYPTTAADGTKGVRVSATDKVTGRMLFIGNGVSNAILKVYAPSGGTINGASADAAFSSASGKGVVIVCLDQTANSWLAW